MNKYVAILCFFLGLLEAAPVWADTLPEYTASPSAELRTSPSAQVSTTPTVVQETGELCTGLQVVSGNNKTAPATIVFQAQVGEAVTQLKYHFGDGEIVESVNKNISHEYVRAGDYEVYAEVKGETGWYTSPAACATKVTVVKAPLTREGLGCNELLVSGDRKAATVSAILTVKGYGELQGYRVVYDDGTVEEASGSGVFTRTYETPGTYGVRGFVRGADEEWRGGEGACRKYVYVYTAGMTSQPQTGVSTGVWMALMTALTSGLLLYRLARRKSAYIG